MADNEKKADTKPAKRKTYSAAEKIARLQAEIDATKQREKDLAQAKLGKAKEAQAKATEAHRKSEARLSQANAEVRRLEAAIAGATAPQPAAKS